MNIEKITLSNEAEISYFSKSTVEEITYTLYKGIIAVGTITLVATQSVALTLIDSLTNFAEKPFIKSIIADDDSVCLITFKRSKPILSDKVNISYTPIGACGMEMISGQNMLVYDWIDAELFYDLVNLNNKIVLFGLEEK